MPRERLKKRQKDKKKKVAIKDDPEVCILGNWLHEGRQGLFREPLGRGSAEKLDNKFRVRFRYLISVGCLGGEARAP